MKEFWNQRYEQKEFAYGEEPNEFIKEKLPLFKKGKILFPADGEGRNAVFAAQLGWDVFAFDFSEKGKEKADLLAKAKGVKIDFTVQSFMSENYEPAFFDIIGLTFVHFLPQIKTAMHKRLDSYLKIGGHIILEAFSRDHIALSKINPAAGGPQNIDMMYSIEDIKQDFQNYEIIELNETKTILKEGSFHDGQSSVIRFVGKKIR